MHVLGVLIKYKYVEPFKGNYDSYVKVKNIHKLLGHITYIMGKVMVFTGMWYA